MTLMGRGISYLYKKNPINSKLVYKEYGMLTICLQSMHSLYYKYLLEEGKEEYFKY